MKSRRAVSEIIASLIILLIVSIMGVILYNLSLSNLGTQQDALTFDTNLSKTMAQQRFEIIAATKFTQNNKSYLNVTFYNYGQVDVKITDVYLENSTGLIHPGFTPSPYLIKTKGELHQSDITYIIVDASKIHQISSITSCEIVSAEGVTNEIKVAL